MYNLTTAHKNALIRTASRLGVSPKQLYILINFESRWNPKAHNKLSGARGLIQFMPGTAKKMGYYNSLDLVTRHPTVISQLEGPVYKYLKVYKPFTSDQSLFLAVFYPDARSWPIYKKFPKIVPLYNPGIYTPSDYIKKVYRSAGLPFIPPFLILIGIGTILYITIKRQKKGGSYARQKAVKIRK